VRSNCAMRRTPEVKTDATARRRMLERSGRRAEAAAALWLQLKGYRIIERRARTPLGEIDLVAARGKMLVFVEVKSRSSFGMALEAVTPELRSRVAQAARLWVSRHRKMQDWLWRFDIVLLSPGRLPRHMRDAWRAES
jgi:putative endonuclease